MTTTPNEPVEDPNVVPSGEPGLPGTQPDPDVHPGPAEDPDAPAPEPDVQPL